jgi:hypothetical protein
VSLANCWQVPFVVVRIDVVYYEGFDGPEYPRARSALA